MRVPAALAEPGSAVQVGYFERRIPFTVAGSPLVDPEMKRLRG